MLYFLILSSVFIITILISYHLNKKILGFYLIKNFKEQYFAHSNKQFSDDLNICIQGYLFMYLFTHKVIISNRHFPTKIYNIKEIHQLLLNKDKSKLNHRDKKYIFTILSLPPVVSFKSLNFFKEFMLFVMAILFLISLTFSFMFIDYSSSFTLFWLIIIFMWFPLWTYLYKHTILQTILVESGYLSLLDIYPISFLVSNDFTSDVGLEGIKMLFRQFERSYCNYNPQYMNELINLLQNQKASFYKKDIYKMHHKLLDIIFNFELLDDKNFDLLDERLQFFIEDLKGCSRINYYYSNDIELKREELEIVHNLKQDTYRNNMQL